MKTKFEYVTDEGHGLIITLEPTGLDEGTGPQFNVEATVTNGEDLSESKSDPAIDITMATGMRQLMEMMSWPEMFTVKTTNFQIGMGDGEDGMMPGMIMGGPVNEA